MSQSFRPAVITLSLLLATVPVYAAVPFYPGSGEPPSTTSPYLTGGVPTEISETGLVFTRATKRQNSTGNTYDQVVTRWRPGQAVVELNRIGPVPPANGAFVQNDIRGMNSAGTLVTSYYNMATSDYTRALRYAAGSVTPEILAPVAPTGSGTTTSAAGDINNAGITVGHSSIRFGGFDLGLHGVYWPAGSTTPTALNSYSVATGGVQQVFVSEINNAGVIAGIATRYYTATFGAPSTNLGMRPVRWSSTTASPVELAPINTNSSGFTTGSVLSLAENGTTVGQTHLYNGATDLGERAVLWAAGGTAVTQLPRPAGVLPLYNISSALELNESGVVLAHFGDSTTITSGDVRTFNTSKRVSVRYTGNGATAELLGDLGTAADGSTYSAAVDVNESGYVVGQSSLNGDFYINRATLWRPGSPVAIDLNTLVNPPAGWLLTSASAISDTGYIGGAGFYDPAGTAPGYTRSWTILLPEAGTYGRGDANFDTLVNFDDLLILAQNYGTSNPTQNVHVGDFDLNGAVNFDDLLALAQHYGSGAVIDTSSLSSTFAADWAVARSMVPEPASGLVIVSGFAGMRRRRATSR